jgi:hypothetical protein
MPKKVDVTVDVTKGGAPRVDIATVELDNARAARFPLGRRIAKSRARWA